MDKQDKQAQRESPTKRPRRRFSDEFKRDAVEIVTDPQTRCNINNPAPVIKHQRHGIPSRFDGKRPSDSCRPDIDSVVREVKRDLRQASYL